MAPASYSDEELLPQHEPTAEAPAARRPALPRALLGLAPLAACCGAALALSGAASHSAPRSSSLRGAQQKNFWSDLKYQAGFGSDDEGGPVSLPDLPTKDDMESLKDSVGGVDEETAGKLQEGIQGMADEAKKNAGDAKEKIKGAVEKKMDDASDSMEKVKDNLHDAKKSAASAVSDMSENVAKGLPGVQGMLDKASGALEEAGLPSKDLEKAKSKIGEAQAGAADAKEKVESALAGHPAQDGINELEGRLQDAEEASEEAADTLGSGLPGSLPSAGSVEDKVKKGMEQGKSEHDSASSAKTELEGAVKEKLDGTSVDLKDMAAKLDTAKEQVGDSVDEIKEKVENKLADAGDTLEGVKGQIEAKIQSLSGAQGGKPGQRLLDDEGSGTKEKLGSALKNVGDSQKALDSIKAKAEKEAESIKQEVEDKLDEAKDHVKDASDSLSDSQGFLEDATKEVSDAKDKLEDAAKDKKDHLRDWFKSWR